MLHFHTSKQKLACLLLASVIAVATGHAQKTVRPQPVWWFGESVAANFNFYRGTTQVLNQSVTTPTAFHKGNGVRPYISLFAEYRPGKIFGGMLNVAYDNRGGKFDQVMAPCDCPADLSTNISYLAIEPSLRIAPFASSFYIFAGPTLNFNISKAFTYEQEKQTTKTGSWSDIKKTSISAQAGAGIDIPLSSAGSNMQMNLSPFVSFQTDLGHQPRTTESWSFYTVRAGMALKFGKAKKTIATTIAPGETYMPVTVDKDVQFSVRAPKVLPLNRRVKETFPFRNSVFFDLGSPQIPGRYVQITNSQAASFNESQLQESQPDNLDRGRSARQLTVYHNILNIMGDRMRANPSSTISLTGAAEKNPVEGKEMAENIKSYLVTVFGIDGSRISTEGRDKPLIPSEQPGGTKELVLLREGDRRVDIESTSPELLLQVGGIASPFLKPVQIIAVQADPMDSHVIFTNAGASETLSAWSVEVTDEKGQVQHFGPYKKNQASVPGNTILGANAQGNYKIVMIGQANSGKTIRKESSVSLMKRSEPKQEGLRYSILFDFDKSKSISTYEKFLTEVVTPLVPEDGTIIIHGHTDIIGDETYNHTLSHDRAAGTQQIIERALAVLGKKGVRFETYGFGEDVGMSPFENNLPEERFYNRTVIIDIIPGK
ncbi:MAG: OmpA family protein [Chitinophagaceae bacterium]|nr:OmpA family protein [Chitinophagaceae bacterium]